MRYFTKTAGRVLTVCTVALIGRVLAEECADSLSTSICETQMQTYGFNEAGTSSACYGTPEIETSWEEDGTLSGMCPECSHAGLCDASCGFCGDTPFVIVELEACGGFGEPDCPEEETPEGPQVEEHAVVSPWAFVVSPLLLVLGFAALGFLKVKKGYFADQRSVVGSSAAVLLCFGLALGQGMVSFDVNYDVGLNGAGKAASYDFYEGVEDMYKNSSEMLAILLLVFSGIWPFGKQLLTGYALGAGLDPQKEFTLLKFLGVSGKTAFLDIGIVTLIVTTLNIDLNSADGTVEGFIYSVPANGALLLIILLILSRVLTSLLIHKYPPPGLAEAKAASAPAETEVPKNAKVCLFACAVLSPVLVVAGLCLPYITRSYSLTYIYPPEVDIENLDLGHGSDTYTIWGAIDGCRTAPGGEAGLRAAIAWITLIFSVFGGIVHALAPAAGLLLAGRGDTTRTAHCLQLLNEWASLEVMAIGTLALGDQIDEMAESLSKNMGFDEATGEGAMMSLEILVEGGLWLILAGSLMSLFGTLGVLRYYYVDARPGSANKVLELKAQQEKAISV